MIRARSILVAAVVGFLVVGMLPAPAVAQDQVTMTVTVETNDDQAVSGADLTVSWDDGSTEETTASNGKAFLDVPEGATVDIEVDHPDYIRNSPYTVEDAQAREVGVTVYPRASTSFLVRDESGKVNDVSVRLLRRGEFAVWDSTEDGRVETGDIEAGTYELLVEKAGYYDEVSTIELEPGSNPERTVRIERGTVTLGVNVTDDYFEPPQPIAAASASVEGVGSAQTQSNGKQQLSVPVNTELTLTLEKDGYQTVERTFTTGEEDLTVAVTMRRSASIDVSVLNDQVVVGQPVFVEVVDEYQDPISNGTVVLDGEEVATTDADGRAQLSIDAAGEHTIVVRKGGIDSDETVVTGVETGTVTATETPTATPTETPTTTATPTETTEAPVPGFGPIVAVLGVVLGIGLAVRRRVGDE